MKSADNSVESGISLRHALGGQLLAYRYSAVGLVVALVLLLVVTPFVVICRTHTSLRQP
jgi:hypothetical protein